MERTKAGVLGVFLVSLTQKMENLVSLAPLLQLWFMYIYAQLKRALPHW